MERETAFGVAVARVLRHQDGVVSRRQLTAAGLAPHDVARMVRRRELRRVHPGVFVDHTGPLTRRQREWTAVLCAWPAALASDSALPEPDRSVIEVVVAHGRKVRVPRGVVVHRRDDLGERVQWHRSPPAVRVEHAVIDMMADALAGDDVARAFSVLSRAIGSRWTRPDRVLTALGSCRRVAGRAVIEAMVADVRDGVCSILERGYRTRVERAHGLPRARRQRPSTATGKLTRQDVRYEKKRVVVELDGRAFHSSAAARDDDAMRDLAETASCGALTLRLTYGLVFSHTCRTAAWIGEVLRQRGWADALRRCPACPDP